MSSSTDGLSTKAARGAVLTLSGQIGKTVIQALGVVVLARLLTPADFGLIVMVVAFAGIGEVVRELGLGLAAIQAKDLTTAQRDNLFWANTLLGCGMGVVFFVMSWPIASLYGDERLIAITQCVAATFVFNGMAAQYRASLQRDLRYAGVVVADVISMMSGVFAAIGLAVIGWGYWAVVIQQIVQPVVGLAIVVAVARWVPGRIRRRQGTRSLLLSGSNIFGYQLLTYISRNIDTVMVGARFGAVDVGIYSRAFQLVTVPLAQLLTPSVRIAVSVLAKLQDDIALFARYLQRAQDATLFACFGLLALLYGVSSHVVNLLLGPNWAEVVPIFEILAIAGVFQVLSFPPYWAFLALGKTRANLLQAVVARVLLIAAVAVGSIFSVEGVAIGYALGTALAWPIAMITLSHVSPLRVTPLILSSCRQLAVFGGGAALVRFCDAQFEGSSVASIAAGLIVMALYVGVVAAIWPMFRRDAVSVYEAFSRLRNGKATA